MNTAEWKALWLEEEAQAHIHGWDFSHLQGRFEEEHDLPWSYRALVREYLRGDMTLLDCDTGGGEFLLSLGHPASNTAAIEGYPPNVELCRETLPPLGIDFRECADPSAIPFPDSSFDRILNRHGAFDPAELFRLLKPGAIFLTEQVGEDNDRDLVERVLPGIPKPFPHKNLREQRAAFEAAGFQILRGRRLTGLLCSMMWGPSFGSPGSLRGSFPASPWSGALTDSWTCRRSWRKPEGFRGPFTAI